MPTKRKPSQGPAKSGGRQKGTQNKTAAELSASVSEELNKWGDDGYNPVHKNIAIAEACIRIAEDKKTGIKDKHKYYSVAQKINTDLTHRIFRTNPVDINNSSQTLEDMLKEHNR